MSTSRRITLKFRGRTIEVRHQPWKTLAGVAMLAAYVVLFAVVLAVLIVVVPLSIPGHFILRALGRRGFWKFENASASYEVGLDGFRRRS